VLTWKAHKGDVRGVAFSPDGSRLATHANGDPFARIWDVSQRKQVAEFETPARAMSGLEPAVACIAFSRCGAYLAVGGSSPGDSRPSLRVWELATEKVVTPLLRSPDVAMGLAFTPDDPPGMLVADGNRLSYFKKAILSKGGTEPEVYNRGPDRKAPKCSRVVYSADLKWVGTNGKPKATVWDAKTLKPKFVREHPKGPQNGPAAFDPGGEVLAVAHGTKIDLWRFADASAAVVELVGHKLPVWAVGFLHEGRTVQTASSDGTVRLWDAATGTERHRYDFEIGKLYSAAFAPDGLTCAAGGENGQVVIWDVDA
jgi:WD40 repeat protein